MSGLDGLQAATSAIQLADLAWETALLIRKVCRAHKDAEELFKKTQILARLLKNVGRVLEKRSERRGDRLMTNDEQSHERSIESSLELCQSCLQDIHSTFKGLVDRDPDMSKVQLCDRLRFVRKQKYIADRERDIGIQLSYLSVALQCLEHEDRADQQARDAAERQTIEQSTRRTQEMHEAFLRQLFALLQYVFQQASEVSTTATRQTATATATARTRRPSEAIGPHDQPTVGLEEPQPTLPNIFSQFANQQDPQRRVQEYIFDSGRVIEEVDIDDDNDDDDNGIDVVDVDLAGVDSTEPDLEMLERQLSLDLSRYTNDTTFLLAIKRGEVDLVRNLLEEDADTTAKDSHGWTVLHHAVFCTHVGIVEILLEHEKSRCSTPEILNAQTKTGETALIYAVQRAGTLEGFNIAQMLLDQQGCDVNVDDGVGPALYYAVSKGKPTSRPRRSLVQTLLSKEADVHAVYEKDPESVNNYDVLVQHIQSNQARTASMVASRRRSTLTRLLSGTRRASSSAATSTSPQSAEP